jgi:hypothetical protein
VFNDIGLALTLDIALIPVSSDRGGVWAMSASIPSLISASLSKFIWIPD